MIWAPVAGVMATKTRMQTGTAVVVKHLLIVVCSEEAAVWEVVVLMEYVVVMMETRAVRVT